MAVTIAQDRIDAAEFADILHRSGLAARRPVNDAARLQRMLDGADLVITARDGSGQLIGLARAITDFSYCCYLSDLAVDRAFQGRGIGQKLIAATRAEAGRQSMCLLIAAPDAVGFYRRIGMPECDRAFLYPKEE
ncbi:MAG: GNAT family N-acetyltransferase [Paracoccus sp. (in: a-proteobacteria)]|nr:GNAT family N-acetyltransferase [Paracoccus sp. (in: a-proteobacteria)]